jgi:hypothetical protein
MLFNYNGICASSNLLMSNAKYNPVVASRCNDKIIAYNEIHYKLELAELLSDPKFSCVLTDYYELVVNLDDSPSKQIFLAPNQEIYVRYVKENAVHNEYLPVFKLVDMLDNDPNIDLSIKVLNLNIKETKFIKIKRTSGKQFIKNLHETNFFNLFTVENGKERRFYTVDTTTKTKIIDSVFMH